MGRITDAAFELEPGQVTANYNKGQQVKSVEELLRLAEAKLPVWLLDTRAAGDSLKPAAFLINWNGAILVGIIKRGQIFRVDRRADPKIAAFGKLIDCLITDPDRVSMIHYTCDDDQFSKGEFDLALQVVHKIINKARRGGI